MSKTPPMLHVNDLFNWCVTCFVLCRSFSICPDSQVLLTEPSDRACAYVRMIYYVSHQYCFILPYFLLVTCQVHYFALNDIQARGYLRQYCLCYITSSLSKLIDNFEALQQEFSMVCVLCNDS